MSLNVSAGIVARAVSVLKFRSFFWKCVGEPWSCITWVAAHQLEHFYLGHFLYTVLIIAKLTDI